MNERDENELLEKLKSRHAKITPNIEFNRELEEKLVQRFGKNRRKVHIFLPAFAFIAACIISFLVVYNSDFLTPVSTNSIINPEIYIYQTHNTESFIPNLPEGTSLDQAFDDEINISSIGQYLSDQLESKGIDVIHEKRDIQKQVLEEQKTYEQSYEVTGTYVKEILQEYPTIQMILDIHRNTLTRNETTIEIEGKAVARIFFVISGNHPNFKENEALAKKLHEKAELMFPGLSKGVLTKKGASFSSNYNQDLFNGALLVEMGGPENSIDELKLTSKYLTEIILQVMKEDN